MKDAGITSRPTVAIAAGTAGERLRPTRLGFDLSRVAKLIGAVAFLLTEIAALFGSWIVASIRCCGAGAAGPQTTQDWVAIAVFAVIMVVPAALVGAGAVLVTEGV